MEALDQVESLKTVLIIGKAEKESKDCCIALSTLLEDGDAAISKPVKKVEIDWEKDTIYLPFTSTTSGSKGIQHTHKSLMSSFYSPEGAANHWFDQLTGDPAIVSGNWFFHMTGLYCFALAAIYGITLYTQSDYTDTGLLEAITETKVNTVSLYSWQIRMLSQSPEVVKYDLSCLKSILTAGSILSATIRMEAMERLPSLRYIREAYGLNEVGLVTLTYPREKKTSSIQGGLKPIDLPDDHVMPVGLPTMYSQIKIISRQTSEPVQGPDEQGEICVKSPQVFKGYLESPEEPVLDSEGFFHTGDLGYYDKEGQVYFIESIANLIHFWMYEVAPSILESRLLSSNNIVDAAVVGITDKENGQVPRAFVVLRPGFEETEENLTNLMESRLQDHERIRGGLYFIQSIPRDENWKVRRDILLAFEPKKPEDCTLNVSAALPSLMDQVCESPKLTKKMQVQELTKLPNGAFVASPQAGLDKTSPRAERKALKKGSESLVLDRRGSMDCILEDTVADTTLNASAAAATRGGARRASRLPSGSRGSSRRGSTDLQDPLLVSSSSMDSGLDKSNNFTYWLQVTVAPQVQKNLRL